MIAAALTFSCQKAELADNGVVDNNSDKVVDFVPGPGKILAVSPTGPDTKIGYGTPADGKYPVVWTNGDAVKLYSENSLAGEKYTYNVDENVSSAVFTGNPIDGQTRYAVYPETRAYGMTEDGKLKISFDVLKKQEYHTSVQANNGNLRYMPMWAQEGDGDNAGVFTFNNLCGIVSFRFNDYQELRGMKIQSVKISSASKYISGVATLNPADGSIAFEAENADNPDGDKEIIVSREKGLAIGNTNKTPSISDEGAKGYLIALPAGEYEEGDLTVTITDSFGRVFTQTVNKPLTVLPGIDKTFKTLSFTFAYGDDNCLVLASDSSKELNVGMKYSFATNYLASDMVEVKDAEGKPYGLDTLTVDVAWEIFESGEEFAKKNALISVEKISGNKVIVTSTQNRGNALVVLKDSKNTILWSWHIWVVDDLGTLNFGQYEIQNMNLGATSVALKADGGDVTNPDAMGLYYQYGRKDPFVISKQITRATKSPYLSGKELTSYVERPNTNDNVQARVDWTIKNPNCRIIRSASPQTEKHSVAFDNWTHDETELKKYWHETEKTIYDPCPNGYKVPHYDVFASIATDSNSKHIANVGYLINTNSSTLPSEAKYDSSTVAYFPNCGFLLHGTIQKTSEGVVVSEYAVKDGSPLHMYTYRAHCWSTTIMKNGRMRVFPGGASGLHTYTNNNIQYENPATRASANNIRCVKIQQQSAE